MLMYIYEVLKRSIHCTWSALFSTLHIRISLPKIDDLQGHTMLTSAVGLKTRDLRTIHLSRPSIFLSPPLPHSHLQCSSLGVLYVSILFNAGSYMSVISCSLNSLYLQVLTHEQFLCLFYRETRTEADTHVDRSQREHGLTYGTRLVLCRAL